MQFRYEQNRITVKIKTLVFDEETLEFDISSLLTSPTVLDKIELKLISVALSNVMAGFDREVTVVMEAPEGTLNKIDHQKTETRSINRMGMEPLVSSYVVYDDQRNLLARQFEAQSLVVRQLLTRLEEVVKRGGV